MKLSYQWLNQYLPLEAKGIKPAALAEKLARTSVEIDGVTTMAAGMKKVVVGEIMESKPHPDSDHLQVVQVKVADDEIIQVVCGAPNVVVGKKAITALSGARLADGVKIRRGKLRGIQSNGMLCALQELGFGDNLAPKPYDDGLWYLPDDAKVGESVFSYLGMDDPVIETDVTPNRGDMLSMLGNVNDLAAIYELDNGFTTHPVEETGTPRTADLIKATVDPALAPSFNLRVVKNVRVADSPLWLQRRLWTAGIRPVNNVVDVTNYVLLKYGQPLHAYDYQKLPEPALAVRAAREQEPLTTLDGEKRTLTAQDLVVTSADQPVALAGTMGGEETKVTPATTTVVLEAAIFDPIRVRKQSRRLDLHSASSMRFERGINPETVVTALNEAAYWLQKLAQGQATSGVVTASELPATPTPIALSVSRVNAVLGTNLTKEAIERIFERLAFAVEDHGEGALTVLVPARRWDIRIAADLYEEIARLYGYDKLPSTLPGGRTQGALTPRQSFLRASRHVLEGLGLNQAISYSLTTVKKAAQFQIAPSAATPMELAYPMSSDHVATRMNIVAGLLDDVAYNVARKVTDVALFEQGRVFIPVNGQARPQEEEHVAGALTGNLTPAGWHQPARPVDFYTLKGIVERYLANMAIAGPVDYVATSERPDLHPGRTANIMVAGQLVGYLGQVHPTVAKAFRIPATYVFELNLEALLAAKKRGKHYRHVSKYPAITRDVALLVDQTVTNAQVQAVIRAAGGHDLVESKLFDLYQGEHLPAGKQSLAYTLTYQAPDRTLTEDEVTTAFEKVVQALVDQLQAEIR